MGKVGRGGPVLGVGVRDVGYPVRLQELKQPPDPVYLVGSWDHAGPCVAIVGARNATEDGIDVARGLAGSLAQDRKSVV